MNYCKVIDGQVVAGPCGLPSRERLADGSTRTALDELSAEELRALGWWPCVETRPELVGATEAYGQPALTVDAVDGVVLAVYPVVTVPDPAFDAPLSKLEVRRWLRSRGLEAALDATLAGSAQAAADWADAQVVRLSDPLLAAALPAFREAAGLTDADIADLVAVARQDE